MEKYDQYRRDVEALKLKLNPIHFWKKHKLGKKVRHQLFETADGASMSSTPMVLGGIMVAGFLVSLVNFDLLGRIVSLLAFVMLCVWGYARSTGTMPELTRQIDETSDRIRDFMEAQFRNLG